VECAVCSNGGSEWAGLNGSCPGSLEVEICSVDAVVQRSSEIANGVENMADTGVYGTETSASKIAGEAKAGDLTLVRRHEKPYKYLLR
jgi:hypothetical protein